ncbi:MULTISPECIES: long-chain-fatty-acid--CoA ligase [Streptomyces]|uniref:Long-chain fatty acid--CoA ligase n=1 Tax=Streptomyces thermoviolaceus subsp. thermoviolaceus TaxID=66860 RepID=A0ABX0YN46_STRTL|nr:MULTISPECIES: long-chain fatty acid--CoA ligase [Streptomyces]MCM3266450.1 long-chain fatty acid--CoA ligase [Streptomyces thermoviolaceus]NJP13379.1 long-chain fatty acid--CoA ligase [Streptomyces thermoviolaceus subsp. thermoviolaceus]RSR98637.1 long-chain fatty acid--CoA ligase [Streptomyces sp. WAC00469]WTD46451.1 long-chain fatty acid--CoA ligase [Streptomyces thermoviolaceus]GGV66886.1 AMP-dependent synthetase [Streptomyces thermoviolaceus subsp. apingens]
MATLSVAAVLAENARRRPHKTALVEGAVRLSFAEVWQRARARAGALVERGVRPGDRVALMAPNTAEFPVAYYAIAAAGAVVVPVHLLLSEPEVEHVLKDSGARLLLCHPAQADTGTAAARAVGVDVVTLGEEFDRLAADAEPLPSYVTRDADDPAVVFYTSGTTGVPKGAVLSHFNLVMNATVSAFDANDVRPDDIALGALPLFHAFGQTVSLNSTWRAGATLVLLPRFDAARAIELMVKEGVNTFHGVPTMFVALAAAAQEAEVLPELRVCVSGGASLPVAVLERFEAAFGAKIHEGYGLSETSPAAAVNQPVFGVKPGTVGHPLWGVDVEIARAETEDRIELLAPGELGEVVVRGHNVFSGYLGRPEATAEALVDGWFRTGDLGTKDDEGFIRIVDRKKDVVIRGGYNVYPREVEEVLLRHPAIAQVAVIGVPDDLHGEEVCAVVVPAPGTDVAPDEIVAWSKERLGRHKYPRRVEITDALPLGPSMKVLKRELRARYAGA